MKKITEFGITFILKDRQIIIKHTGIAMYYNHEAHERDVMNLIKFINYGYKKGYQQCIDDANEDVR